MLAEKVIETNYNGILFRSRTEARWAVFFDTAGIYYEYESEGYDLDGEWYLPDFWLPELNLFVEVKGQEPTYKERALARTLSITKQAPIIVFVGSPFQVSTKNLIFLPPKTQQEWDECLDPRKVTWGWCMGNIVSNCDGELYFDRLGKTQVFLGPITGSLPEAFNAARSERFGVHA